MGFLLLLFDRAKNPLSFPLGLFCLALFTWNFAMLAYAATGARVWRWVDNSASPLSAALTLHVVLVFVGQQRRLRALLYLAYACAFALAAVAVAAFVLPAAQRWIESEISSIVYLIYLAALAAVQAFLLVRHLRLQVEDEERMRTRIFLAALILGAIFFSTELWKDIVPVPSLGQLGALLVSLLLVAVVLRLRKATHAAALRALAYASALGALAVFGYTMALNRLATDTNLAVLGVMVLTGLLSVALAELVMTRRLRKSRERRLLFLGRFSDQLAHDLKNPLAALRGAVDFLLEEHRQQRSLDDQVRFVELIGEQARRIEGAIEGYRRFGREPEREPVEIETLITTLVERSVALEAKERGITLDTKVEPSLGSIALDVSLIGRALENVLRNALEALESGGTLAVEVSSAGSWLRLCVRDDGRGMNARDLARATDEFFSTKGSSGLGLAFVRNVTEAHGGRLEISSALGVGTTVELFLPQEAESGGKSRDEAKEKR